MSRSGTDYTVGGRNFQSGSLSLRRGLRWIAGGTASTTGDAVENLDLFARNRTSVSVSSSDDSSDASSRKLGRLSVGSSMASRSRMDDLLSFTGREKNDYDWLLTPPATPQFHSSDQSKCQDSQPTTRASSQSKSRSSTNASRLSELNQSSKPIRSKSATSSSSNSTFQSTTYSSSSILNTSSASVSSYTRPSIPITRSTYTTRTSTHSSTSRPSTPSRISSNGKPKPSQLSRPSTPTSRPQISTARSNSRSSTPIRRNPAPPLSQSTSISSAHLPSRSTSSSPGPRLRPTRLPIIPPDFPLETPPNLRTTLPNRPLSAGRSRPLKGSSDIAAPANGVRRLSLSSPVISSRGRITAPDDSTRSGGTIKSSVADAKSLHPLELVMKAVTNSTETTGFGRNISKNSMDMAMWHMDLRNCTNLRVPSSTTIYPQSIRSSASKSQEPNQAPHNNRETHKWIKSSENNGDMVGGNGNYSAELSDMDTILLEEEDLKNTNWLHNVDYKCDRDSGSISDDGFEPLPEPFLRSD